ncbi:MAG: hydroxyacylglutathione hydrolase, partial [Novosphingobium sp.]
AKIAAVDHTVAQGDIVTLGSFTAEVIDVGGHTLGHCAYYLPQAATAFVGDALFPLGCGRMFEGTPEQFWASLLRLKALPPKTTLYSAHEYTQSNARFAIFADPDNAALEAYAANVDARRERGQWTVPTTLEAELAANPFLRADASDMAERWGGISPIETFAALRAAKDTFR